MVRLRLLLDGQVVTTQPMNLGFLHCLITNLSPALPKRHLQGQMREEGGLAEALGTKVAEAVGVGVPVVLEVAIADALAVAVALAVGLGEGSQQVFPLRPLLLMQSKTAQTNPRLAALRHLWPALLLLPRPTRQRQSQLMASAVVKMRENRTAKMKIVLFIVVVGSGSQDCKELQRLLVTGGWGSMGEVGSCSTYIT